SLYLLELYPNAPLKEAMARATAVTPCCAARTQAPDHGAAHMDLQALERLDAAGFVQYESSNVARSGQWSRHNVKYWQGGGWRGFGCGAHSTLDGVRWKNISATADYIERVTRRQSPVTERQPRSAADQIGDALITGLRLASGADTPPLCHQSGGEPRP